MLYEIYGDGIRESREEITALARMLDEAFDVPREKLTGDPLEEAVWRKCSALPKTYGYSFIIWNWFQKEKAADKDEAYLNKTYVEEFDQIVDNLRVYDDAVAAAGGRAEFDVGGLRFDTKDNAGLQRMRSANGLNRVLDALEKLSVGDEKGLLMQAEDFRNIVYIGRHEDVVCWRTKTFQSTNRFIYGLWRNKNMNSSIGQPDRNSPFCTRIPENWKKYSHHNPDYCQYWFFLAADGTVPPGRGTLAKKTVRDAFRAMSGRGGELLVGLTDTYDDNNDRSDGDLHGKYPPGAFKDADGVSRSAEMAAFIGNELAVVNIGYGFPHDLHTLTLKRMLFDGPGLRRVPAKRTGRKIDLMVVEERLVIADLECEYLPQMKDTSTGRHYLVIKVENCPNLKSLEGLNLTKAKQLQIRNCPSLETLAGCPIAVQLNLDIDRCPKLKSLTGAPSYVGGNIYVDQSGVTDKQRDAYEKFLDETALDGYGFGRPRYTPYDEKADNVPDYDSGVDFDIDPDTLRRMADAASAGYEF